MGVSEWNTLSLPSLDQTVKAVAARVMNCKKATKDYEAWLANHTQIIEADLVLKHQQMSADTFSFMRATFYRWVELWSKFCDDLAKGSNRAGGWRFAR
jgi:hypothetical protein